MKRHLIFASLILVFCFTLEAYGHGGSSEIFPPVNLNGKQVTLEVAALQESTDSQQISVSFLDFDSKITLRDVTFHISAERGDQSLFEREFLADSGVLVFDFISENTSITLEEQEGDFFGSLLGLDTRKINVKGPKLDEGGLYKFNISILTADGYSKKLDEPLTYDVGISIPQTTSHEISHPDYGDQTIQTITYYDEISEFEYDINSKEISFSMPFDWTRNNIEKTTVVHQELVIPKEFGELLVSGFTMYVNDIKLSENIVTIDDFEPNTRIIHFIINQQELLSVFEKNNQQNMNFVIKPTSEKRSAVTQNGQFRVLVSWEPERLESGSDVVVSFNITDVFLRNTPVIVNYDFSITQNDKSIFRYSDSSKNSTDTIKFVMPDVSGIIHFNFNNLDGNARANTTFPVIVNSAISNSVIPSWIKDSASWWVDGSIDDDTFIQGVEFLIQNDIILVDTSPSDLPSTEIPSWIKDSASWWVDGSIDDDTFVKSLEFLIEKGIIQI